MTETHERDRRGFWKNSAGWIVAVALAFLALVSNYGANAARLQVAEQRVEKLESQTVQRQEITEVNRRLERIENKLDKLADERAEKGKK